MPLVTLNTDHSPTYDGLTYRFLTLRWRESDTPNSVETVLGLLNLDLFPRSQFVVRYSHDAGQGQGAVAQSATQPGAKEHILYTLIHQETSVFSSTGKYVCIALLL